MKTIFPSIFFIILCHYIFFPNFSLAAKTYGPKQAISDWNGQYIGNGSINTYTFYIGLKAPTCNLDICTLGDLRQYGDSSVNYPNVRLIPSFKVQVCTVDGSGNPLWVGTAIAGGYVSSSYSSTVQSIYPYDDDYNNAVCSADTCASKAGQATYNLKEYDSPDNPPVSGEVCYEGCANQSSVLWNDCLAGSCVASIKYVATGAKCGAEPPVTDLTPEPPDRCTEQINEKIAQCGGTLKVLSFDFETCTGECTPDSCGDKWNELVNRCGGIMAVSTWNNETCSGSCVNDPVPDIEEPSSEAVPNDINTETKTNPDGSKVVTQTETYYVDNTTYTNTTTTTYDPSGNKTGSSKSSSSKPTTPSGSGGSAPSSWYTKTCDLTKGFESCVNFQQIRDATAAFNNTFIIQFPNLILDCLGYVEGDGCVYPPVLTIDFHNAFTSDDIKIDLAPFESVSHVMKFFFSLLCLLLTGKAVMYLFQ